TASTPWRSSSACHSRTGSPPTAATALRASPSSREPGKVTTPTRTANSKVTGWMGWCGEAGERLALGRRVPGGDERAEGVGFVEQLGDVEAAARTLVLEDQLLAGGVLRLGGRQRRRRGDRRSREGRLAELGQLPDDRRCSPRR